MLDQTQRSVDRAALQAELPELGGLALHLLCGVPHVPIRMHGDIDPTFADDVVQLDVDVVQRTDDVAWPGERIAIESP